jgi:hypothetical protein
MKLQMTDQQKFLFDLKGWIVLPAVLGDAEVAACRKHLQTLADAPHSLPEHERNTYSGPCQELLDHPALVPILREIIAADLSDRFMEPATDGEPAAYGFRCDNSFSVTRAADPNTPWGAHNGGPSMGPSHNYEFVNGKMLAPAVRVVWELSPVAKNGGGTPFLSGSHKSNYEIPFEYRQNDDLCWESYACPAGSMVVFSENVCHASAPWTDTTQPRMAIFNHYLHYCMRFHRMAPEHATIEAMPPLRRTLFRDVWMFDRPENKVLPNSYYAADNRARGSEE